MPPKTRKNQATSEASTKLHQDTPDWGIAMYELLAKLITTSSEEVNTKITQLLNQTVEPIRKTAQKALDLANGHTALINSLEAKVNNLNDLVMCLQDQNNNQQRHILQNESYSRRDNLLFSGYPPSNKKCDVIVREIMKLMNIDNVDSIQFVRCHYVEEKSKIIVRFQFYADRERVWKGRFNLKNHENRAYYVSEDFPRAIVAERKQLYPVFRAAKQLPVYNNKVTVVGNRLRLDDRYYTVDTLQNVPQAVHPAALAERTSNEVHVFGGTTSRFCKFSNYFQRDFVYEHRLYKSAEQAFQCKKARCANDTKKCREIMFSSSPDMHKQLGERVTGLNVADWNENKISYMKDILMAKFTQHVDLKGALLDTGNKIIAEANARDQFYAIGLPLTSDQALNQGAWTGQNKLGELLMQIRDELR